MNVDTIQKIVFGSPAGILILVLLFAGVVLFVHSSARRQSRRDEIERLELERLRREVPPTAPR